MSLCRDGAVFISGQPARCVGCFKEEKGGSWHRALSIIHLTCHRCEPPRGRAREYTDEQKLVRCEREWGGGWSVGEPRQKGKKKGMKRMTGDKQGLAREKSRGRVDNKERERRREG